MRTTILIIFFFITVTSCFNSKKAVREAYRHEMHIDYKYISYQGQNSSQQLYLEIDSVKGMWYHGKLIVNHTDTFLIRGFDKFDHYVTTYNIPGTKNYGGIHIWSRGKAWQIRDSLTLESSKESDAIVEELTVLYRQPRKTCQ